jgi:ParB family chromosome partitioning protein
MPVTAIVEAMGDQETIRDMVTENDLHHPPSAWEQGQLYCQLLDEEMFSSMRAMATFLRRDPGDVSRAMTLARVPTAILEAMTDPRALALHDAGAINAAMKLGSDRAVQLSQASLESSGKLAPKALIKLLIDGPAKKADTTVLSPPMPIVLLGRTVGSVQVESLGQLVVNVHASIPPGRQEEIKRRVADYLQELLS